MKESKNDERHSDSPGRNSSLYNNEHHLRGVAVNLSDHIQQHHNGSQSEAARCYKVSRQVMAHWLKRGAIVYNERIYLPVRTQRNDHLQPSRP